MGILLPKKGTTGYIIAENLTVNMYKCTDFTHALHDLASNAQTDTIGILKVLWSLDDCSPFPISYLMLRFSLYYSMVQRSIVPEGRQ